MGKMLTKAVHPACLLAMFISCPAASGKTVLIIPNIDDLDGKPDATDGVVNGPIDRQDLTRIQLPFRVTIDQVVFSGPGRHLYRVVEMDQSVPEQTVLLVEATGPRSKNSNASISFRNANTAATRLTLSIDVQPFVLNSSVDSVQEVFVVKVPASKAFIADLSSTVRSLKAPPPLTVLSVKDGDDIDVWIQDAAEIGQFDGSTMSVALRGLRGNHSGPMNATPLDNHFAKTFLGKNRSVLSVGNPLPNRKWIDWFGNLEVTPPYVAPDGRRFPKGRILTGKQGDLTMHDSVTQFLENQGVQWPPIVLDTGFLMIGHIDEIVNFVPTKDGFKVLLASPTKGRQLIEKLARQGYGDSRLLVGKSVENGTKAEISVDEILQNRELTLANANAERVMEKNRLRLKQELGMQFEVTVADAEVSVNGSPCLIARRMIIVVDYGSSHAAKH